jgi:transposase
MNIKLHNVISDITGKSGSLMIEAILSGVRYAEQLAELADRKVKASKEEICKSLEAYWRDEYLFELKQAYELYKFYKKLIDECDKQIEKALQKYLGVVVIEKDFARKTYNKNRFNFNAAIYLKSILGVDITRVFGIGEISALEIVSEVGTDMSKWPTKKHFTSWLNLAPNIRSSGGKS